MHRPPPWLLSAAHHLRVLSDDRVQLIDRDLESTIYRGRTAALLVAIVEGSSAPPQSRTQLHELTRSGVVVRIPKGMDRALAKRWLGEGLPLDHAHTALRTTINLTGGRGSDSELSAALQSLGFQVNARTPHTRRRFELFVSSDVVVDLLSRDVPSRQPAVVIQSSTHAPFHVWLDPGRTACVTCLRTHLTRSDPAAVLTDRALDSGSIPPDVIARTVARGLALRSWAAPQATIQALVGPHSVESLPDPFPVQRLASCASCGRPPWRSFPPSLQPRSKVPGTHRCQPAAWAIATARRLYHPLVGIARGLPDA